MPLHPNVRRCTHIQVTGHRCGSPALKQEYFCYFHTRMIKGVETRVDSQTHPVALIENAEAIQAALMHTIDAVLKGAIDNKRANLVLKALHIAVRNSRNVRFSTRPDDMVREVPNYAEQYLTEHPELNPPQPRKDNRPNCQAGRSSAEDCHPEEAQAFAKRRPANEGSLHSSADPVVPLNTECHPERARTSRESKDPHSANRGNGATGNSPQPPDGTRKPAASEKIPPLTNRQTERNYEIKNLEASIEGAMHGDWRDLRKVFNAVGLTPRKPSASGGIAHPQKNPGRMGPPTTAAKRRRNAAHGVSRGS
jgi:hypothetical protein